MKKQTTTSETGGFVLRLKAVKQRRHASAAVSFCDPVRSTGFPEQTMNQSRARLIEWIILEDYGARVARENGVLSEAIEAYSFHPM